MHRMRNSILTQQHQQKVEEMGNDEFRSKSHRQDQEICQRFLRLSCHKMISSRGSANLRRNLLILHLLQKARTNLKQVPAECKCLLASESPIQPPNRLAALHRSSSPRAGSPIARKSLFNGRSFQPQQTTPKRLSQPPSAINTSIKEPKEEAPQPTTPPPEENLKTNNAFALVYQALENNEDDVFVDEEKENNDEDVEELFLQKVGKSFISPPISPEKPEEKEKAEVSAGRRLEFSLGHDFFESKPDDEEDEDLPPYLFNCDQATEKLEIKSTVEVPKHQNFERVVPTRTYRSSVSLCLDSNDLKQIENEDCCVTDGDYTEEEDENDASDFGQRFPSFKRRLRKRKTVGGTVRNAIFLAEKRAKDAEHCVPSISI